jgi:hypothetical protein
LVLAREELQTVAPESAYFPLLHAMHPADPAKAENLPPTQTSQSLLSANGIAPGWQLMHTDEPAMANLPSAHAVHAPALLLEE